MFYSPSGDDADWKEESYPFNFGWGAGPVSPSMVQDWKEWSKQQTFLDGYTEDPRISGSIWSYKAMDTIKMAVAIGLGIGAAYSLPGHLFGWKREIEVWEPEKEGKK